MLVEPAMLFKMDFLGKLEKSWIIKGSQLFHFFILTGWEISILT